MNKTNEKIFKKKQNELLQDALSFTAAELEAMKDSFHEVRDCTTQALMQSCQTGMPSFSSLVSPSEPGNVSFHCTPWQS